MKIPEPRKLPSGNWFVQIRMDRRSISITDDNRDRCIARAMAVKTGILEERKHPASITLGKAIDQYIENHQAVWSPSTTTNYKRYRRNQMQELMDVRLDKLSSSRLQRAISDMTAMGYSPKYISNVWGLIRSAISEVDSDFDFGKVQQPQKRKRIYNIPTPDDIRKIVIGAINSDIAIPVLLGLCGGLRMSEIRGLKWSAIDGDTVHVCLAIVDTEEGPVEKLPKTYESDRFIKLPQFLVDILETAEKTSEFVVPLSCDAIRWRFERMCKDVGISKHYRFHDLRHAQASVGMALNIPNKYMQERMGHATENMLRTVYQHTMEKKTAEFSDIINSYFDNIAKENC